MTTLMRIAAPAALVCLLAAGTARAAAAEKPADDVFEQLRRYDDGQPMKPLRAIEMLAARSTRDAKRRREVADQLAAVAADPKASAAAKRFACGQLALVGDDSDVPLLTKMLAQPKTAEMARRVLASIPGEPAGKALRDALGTCQGAVLVGVANALGDRRDDKAVGALAKRLSAVPVEVAAAAAKALGKIGTGEAAEALGRASRMANVLIGLDTLLDAQLRCAGRLMADGQAAGAVPIYRRMCQSRGAVRWRVAGLAGLAKAAGEGALPEVLKAAASDDPQLRGAAMRSARLLGGAETTAALADTLGRLKAEARAMMIDVLADRADKAAAAAVMAHLGDEVEVVRIAAARAMAALGDASVVGKLARLAGGGAGAAGQAARASLQRMADPAVDRELLGLAAKGESAVRVEAIAAVAARRTASAGPALRKLAADPDEPVRVAALDALGVLGGADDYAKLIDTLTGSTGRTAQAAERAALAVGRRLAGPAERTAPVLARLTAAPAAAKPALLGLLAAWGGDDALKAVRAAVGDKDTAVGDAAVRALASWPDTSAAADLLKIARDDPRPVRRTLALRGYLRLARSAGGERLKMLQAVRQIATNAAAKRLLLAGLSDVPDAAALELALGMLDDKSVAAEAGMAALKIGKALLATDRRAVRAGMTKLASKAADPAVVKQAKALHAEALKPAPRRRGAGGTTVGLKPDKARSDAARKELAKRAPKGFRLACYLDCGPDDADGAKPGPTLRSLGGAKYSWAGAERVNVRHATVRFDSREVAFEIAGLKPRRAYQLGFSWWDYDHSTRVQSVWLSAGKPARRVKLLGATKLPAYSQGGKKADEKTLPIPRELSAFGTVQVRFVNEAQPNVVVSEVWLWESEAELAPAKPMGPQANPPTGPTGRRAGARPRVTTPKAVRPGKKAAKRVLIVTGNDYPGHKWRRTCPVLAAGLDKDPRLAVEYVETGDFLRSPKLKDYDTLVLHWMNWQTPDPGPEARKNLAAYVRGGGGFVLVHFACGAFQGWPEFAKLAGRAWNPKLRGHDPRGSFRVRIVDKEHEITKGMKDFDTADELYTCLDGNTPIHVLASSTSKVDKKDYPMAFVLTYGKGRVFHCVLGHDLKAFEAPGVLELFRRGTAWSAGLKAVAIKE